MKAVYAEEPKYFSLTGSITELFLLSLLPPNFGPPWIASDSTACWLALVLGVTVLHTYCRDCLDNYHSLDRRVLQWEYKETVLGGNQREQLEAQGTTEKLDVNIERRALPGSCVPFAGINLVKQIVVIHRRAKEVYLWVESRDGYLWQSLTGCSIVSMKRQIAAINRAHCIHWE